MPHATGKKRQCLVSFTLEHTNANEYYSYRTETRVDVTECEQNCQWTLPLQDIAANEQYRYRTLRFSIFVPTLFELRKKRF